MPTKQRKRKELQRKRRELFNEEVPSNEIKKICFAVMSPTNVSSSDGAIASTAPDSQEKKPDENGINKEDDVTVDEENTANESIKSDDVNVIKKEDGVTAKGENSANEPIKSDVNVIKKEDGVTANGENSANESIEIDVNGIKKEDDVTADGENTTNESIVTKEMIDEENRVHNELVKEEKKSFEAKLEEFKNVEEEIKEQRYQRLQFILNKSNLYTSYLCQRMEKQKQEHNDQIRRREIRLLKQLEKQNTADANNKNEVEAPTLKRSGRQSVAVNIEKSSKIADANNSKGRGKRKRQSEGDQLNIQNFFNKSNSKKSKESLENKENTENIPSNVAETSENENLSGRKSITTNKVDDEVTLSVKSSSSLDVEELCNSQEKDEDEVIPVREINGEVVPMDQPILLTGGVLRSYQVEGFKWMKSIYENGINGILADEMGLGKTIQTIASISHLIEMGINGPYLVVAPLSTVPNWFAEFKRFTPKIPVILYHGSIEQRQAMRPTILKEEKIMSGISTAPVVITSYEISMNDRKHLGNYSWKYLVVDEGHRMKNYKCKLVRELKLYNSQHRLLLTGTPLQNDMSELWSLLNFLLPEIFDDLASFETWFDVQSMQSDDYHQKLISEEKKMSIIGMLHQIVRPFMMRRLKSEVELCVPPKREILVYAQLTEKQLFYYQKAINFTMEQFVLKKKAELIHEDEEILETNHKGSKRRRTSLKPVDYASMCETDREEKIRLGEIIEKTSQKKEDEIADWAASMVHPEELGHQGTVKLPPTSHLHIKLTNICMLLRKCCNHAYLLEYPLNPGGDFKIDEELIQSSGKLRLLDCMLPELKKDGRKIVIFSQFTSMMDILEDYMYLRSYRYCRLDGSMKLEDRQEQIEGFMTDPEIFIFIASTRAGGLGINLTASDTVIIFDSDWNPQCDLQAQDRCHRIGQVNPVLVFRFVTANTIDAKIVERASSKRKLEKMIIREGKFTTGLKSANTAVKSMDPKDLLELLRSTDFDEIIRNQDKVISKKDLKKLLDRSGLFRQWQESRGIETKAKNRKSEKIEDIEGVFKVIEDDVNTSENNLTSS